MPRIFFDKFYKIFSRFMDIGFAIKRGAQRDIAKRENEVSA